MIVASVAAGASAVSKTVSVGPEPSIPVLKTSSPGWLAAGT